MKPWSKGSLTDEHCKSLLKNHDLEELTNRRTRTSRWSEGLSWGFRLFPWALSIVLLFYFIRDAHQCDDPGLAVYSPANPVVEYETIVMFDNIHNESPYQGYPDDTKDALWEGLYGKGGLAFLDSSEALKLPNRTAELPEMPGQYGVQMEVFHQLHCVNSLRKSLYPERFPKEALFFPDGSRNEENTIHYEHCIDRIRQGVQCASNVGTLFWTWREDRNQWLINMTTTHTCRKFDKIQDWAFARNKGEWDPVARGHSNFLANQTST